MPCGLSFKRLKIATFITLRHTTLCGNSLVSTTHMIVIFFCYISCFLRITVDSLFLQQTFAVLVIPFVLSSGIQVPQHI